MDVLPHRHAVRKASPAARRASSSRRSGYESPGRANPSTTGFPLFRSAAPIAAPRASAATAAHPGIARRSRQMTTGARCRCVASEIAAPHDWDIRANRTNRLADRHRLTELRPGHDRNRQERRLARSTPESRAMISAAGSATRLPSTSDHDSRPSSTAASDSTDSGSGCFPGVVDNGLKKRIIARPTPQTPPALDLSAA